MFIVSTLLFISGIYAQALLGLKVRVLFLFLVSLLILVPVLLIRQRKIVALLILASFFLTGMLRISLKMIEVRTHYSCDDLCLFSARVEEKTRGTLILNITYPEELKGLKATFRAIGSNFDLGDKITILGRIKEIVPSHKNPHITPWRWVKTLDGVSYEIKGEIVEKRESPTLIANLRRMAKKKIEKAGLLNAGVVKALSMGDRTSLDPGVVETFQRTGTSHILAISGLHMGIIGGFVFYLVKLILRRSYTMRLSGRDSRLAALFSIPVLIFFMCFFGSSPSTIRATIMIGIYMISLFLERERDLLSTLALSAFVILLISPHSLFVPSFQLSFMSVLFIVLFLNSFGGLLWRIKNRILRWVVMSILTTESAFLGTFPIVLYHFYGVNPLSFAHNLISIPILGGIATPLAVFGVILPYGEFFLRICDLFVGLNLRILEFLNFGYIYPFLRPSLLEALLYYCLLISAIHMKKKSVRNFVIFLLLPVILIYGYLQYENRYGERLCVDFLDVGMGEASLIEGPRGLRMLVDTGGSYDDFNAGRSIVTPILLSKKILTLNYLIITHPHSDHIGGASFLIDNFRINNILTTRDLLRNRYGIELLERAIKRNIKVHLLKEGDIIRTEEGLKITVLNPPRDFLFEDINDNSLVFKLDYRNVSFLFTGDITEKAENYLVERGFLLRVDCLKIPHHGSSSSSSPIFLFKAHPKIAVLTGSYSRGLPAKSSLEKYGSMDIPVFRTSETGCVTVCTDGVRIRTKTYTSVGR